MPFPVAAFGLVSRSNGRPTPPDLVAADGVEPQGLQRQHVLRQPLERLGVRPHRHRRAPDRHRPPRVVEAQHPGEPRPRRGLGLHPPHEGDGHGAEEVAGVCGEVDAGDGLAALQPDLPHFGGAVVLRGMARGVR